MIALPIIEAQYEYNSATDALVVLRKTHCDLIGQSKSAEDRGLRSVDVSKLGIRLQVDGDTRTAVRHGSLETETSDTSAAPAGSFVSYGEDRKVLWTSPR